MVKVASGEQQHPVYTDLGLHNAVLVCATCITHTQSGFAATLLVLLVCHVNTRPAHVLSDI